jgi:hypothetical protein
MFHLAKLVRLAGECGFSPQTGLVLQRIRFHCVDLGIALDGEECNGQIAIRHEHCGGECRGRPGTSGRRENVKVGAQDDTFDGDIKDPFTGFGVVERARRNEASLRIGLMER